MAASSLGQHLPTCSPPKLLENELSLHKAPYTSPLQRPKKPPTCQHVRTQTPYPGPAKGAQEQDTSTRLETWGQEFFFFSTNIHTLRGRTRKGAIRSSLPSVSTVLSTATDLAHASPNSNPSEGRHSLFHQHGHWGPAQALSDVHQSPILQAVWFGGSIFVSCDF